MYNKTGSIFLKGNQLNILCLLFVIIIYSISCRSKFNPKKDVAILSKIPKMTELDSLKIAHDSTIAEFNAVRTRIDELLTKTSRMDSDLRKKNIETTKLHDSIKYYKDKDKILTAKLKKDEIIISSITKEIKEKEFSINGSPANVDVDRNKLAEQLGDLLQKYNVIKELGSVLHASNLRVEPLHISSNGRKEKTTLRARKLNLLRFYFDIDENRIAEDGYKKLYLLITDPDGKLLYNDKFDKGSFTNLKGKTINYSLVKEVYLKKNESVKNISVDWKQEGEHKKGYYSLIIYNEGYKIGAGSVLLN